MVSVTRFPATPASALLGFAIMIFILSISFCKNPIQQASSPKPYFDLTTFFNEQISLLQKDSIVVMKTSIIDDKSDQHEMNWIDWKRELALFTASDINKASLIGKYTIDTIRIDSTERKIRYSTIDSSVRTRLVEVTLKQSEVKQIYIVNKTSGYLSSSSESLLYQPMKAYIVKTSTINRFFGRNDFAMMGEITPKQRQYF